MALDYALRIAARHGVCYAPSEGLLGYSKRVKAWTTYHRRSIPLSLFFLRDTLNLIDQASIVEVINDFAQTQPKLELLIIDTLAMSMIGADENSSRDMGIALAACRRLIDALDCTVMLVTILAKPQFGNGGLRHCAGIRT